jgi:hypothetical protein
MRHEREGVEIGTFAEGLRCDRHNGQKTAQDCQGNNLELLALLRLLEALHQEVRDGLFQDSLPDNRQALYALLKDIENNGGWPHIYRMRLQHFLSNLLPEDEA